jgi:hypothetical protein
MTTEQSMDALQRANQIRLTRAARWGDRGRRQDREYMAGLLVELPEDLYTMTAFEFVRHINQMGRSRVIRMLFRVGISERTQLSRLTDRQRSALVVAIKEYKTEGRR